MKIQKLLVDSYFIILIFRLAYDNTSNDSDKELDQRAVRSVYLVTYSQADMAKFPTRKNFANEVVKYFQSTKVKVLHWLCCNSCIREHEGNMQHFHLALKISKNKRWLPVKRKMQNNHSVVIHFSLTNKSVSDIISDKILKRKQNFMHLYKLKKVELFTFLINKTSKKIEELICTTW